MRRLFRFDRRRLPLPRSARCFGAGCDSARASRRLRFRFGFRFWLEFCLGRRRWLGRALWPFDRLRHGLRLGFLDHGRAIVFGGREPPFLSRFADHILVASATPCPLKFSRGISKPTPAMPAETTQQRLKGADIWYVHLRVNSHQNDDNVTFALPSQQERASESSVNRRNGVFPAARLTHQESCDAPLDFLLRGRSAPVRGLAVPGVAIPDLAIRGLATSNLAASGLDASFQAPPGSRLRLCEHPLQRARSYPFSGWRGRPARCQLRK